MKWINEHNQKAFNTMQEKQTVIINIRTMQEKTGETPETFNALVQYPLESLRNLQEQLIPQYNKVIQENTKNEI